MAANFSSSREGFGRVSDPVHHGLRPSTKRHAEEIRARGSRPSTWGVAEVLEPEGKARASMDLRHGSRANCSEGERWPWWLFQSNEHRGGKKRRAPLELGSSSCTHRGLGPRSSAVRARVPPHSPPMRRRSPEGGSRDVGSRGQPHPLLLCLSLIVRRARHYSDPRRKMGLNLYPWNFCLGLGRDTRREARLRSSMEWAPSTELLLASSKGRRRSQRTGPRPQSFTGRRRGTRRETERATELGHWPF